MTFRQMLLRVMLWSLGIGAVLGAVTILFAEDMRNIGRVSGTILAAAAAAGLMIPCSLMMDRKATRAAGLLGTAVIIAEFFMAVMLIWELADLLPWRDPYWRMVLTMVFAFLCTVAAMYFMAARQRSVARVAADTGVVLAGIAFVLAMFGCWLPGRLEEEWFGTVGWLALFGHIAAICLIGIDRRNSFGPRFMAPARVAGVIGAAAAQAIATYALWQHIHGDITLFTVCVCIGAVVAHANLCLLAPLADRQRWLRWATLAAGAATGVFVVLLAAMADAAMDVDGLLRLASASGFIASCGSLALLILARVNKRMTDEMPVLEEIREITLICPGCNKKHTLPVGQASCPTCRLELRVQVFEPHCPKCDYSLFMLASDRCPECGAAAPSASPPRAVDQLSSGAVEKTSFEARPLGG